MKNIVCIIFIFLVCGCVQRYYNVATRSEEIYFYSTEKEVKIGKAFAERIEKKFQLEDDLLLQQKIKRIGGKLAGVCDRKEIKYSFKLLKDDTVNAFALPGGYVYMFKGLWDKLGNDDALIAAVLSHEIGHICARHSIKRLQTSVGYGILSILVNTAGRMNRLERRKATIGINELLLAYSRADEFEADRLSVKYLGKAGYEQTAVIDVLKILRKEQRENPIKPLAAATHPYISQRIKNVKQHIDTVQIEFNDYINTVP